MWILNILVALLIAAAIWRLARWTGAQSPALRRVLMLGILARMCLGSGLFAISFWSLPVLKSLQAGDGFWVVMLDARNYYHWAATAATTQVLTLPPEIPSRFFVRTLALWLRAVGSTPLAAVFLNLCLFVLACASLTRLYRPTGRISEDQPLLIAVGAISFCPVVLLDSTQALKDDLFLSLIIWTCCAAWLLLTDAGHQRYLGIYGLALGLLTVCFFGMAGMRWYYPLLALSSLAICGSALLIDRQRPWLRRVPVVGLMCTVPVAGYWTGAGADARPNKQERTMIVDAFLRPEGPGVAEALMARVGTVIEVSRTGFVKTGGATNVVERPTATVERPSLSQEPAASQAGTGAQAPSEHNANRTQPLPASDGAAESVWRRLSIGLSTVFVPITVLRAASVVQFEGGRNLLPIADADTLFIDGSCLLLGLTIYRRRSNLQGRMLYLAFTLLLAIVTAVLLAYVVTNFGTLFRLRYMVAAPLWMAALACAPVRRRQDGLSI